MKSAIGGRVVVTRLDRHGEALGWCDEAEGFFVADPYFRFRAFLDDAPGADTYPETRLREFYFFPAGDDFPQYSWSGTQDSEPNWDFGKQLLTDLVAGIESALRYRTSENGDYCQKVAASAVERLIWAGIERKQIASALKAELDKLLAETS